MKNQLKEISAHCFAACCTPAQTNAERTYSPLQHVVLFPVGMLAECVVTEGNFSKAASTNKGVFFIIAAVSVVYLCDSILQN